jgi:hypothetical protein
MNPPIPEWQKRQVRKGLKICKKILPKQVAGMKPVKKLRVWLNEKIQGY